MLRRLFAQLRKTKPAPPAHPGDLALVLKLHQAGQHAQAEAVCRELLAREPAHPDALHVLGITLLAQKKAEEAVPVLARVAEGGNPSAEAHYNLASAYRAKGDPERAVASYRKALELAPARVEACIGAAGALGDLERYADAEAQLREAIARKADYAPAHYNLALVLVTLQRFDEAIASYRAALEHDPAFQLAHSNLMFLLNGHSTDAAEIFREHREWARIHALPLAAAATVHPNARDPQRRLRVGYVSPDFWNHPVAQFIEPVLERHDRRAVEVWCYYSNTIQDPVTARLRKLGDRWIDCAALDDEALAARLRDDRIDVLVDLAGHTALNRLLALARSPAPVSATYLGYPTTTGIPAIGYRITDTVVDRPGDADCNVEAPLYLPHSYYCFGAPPEAAAPGPLPAKANGHVTFGCFNATIKWSDESLRLWAGVLAAVEGAKLLLKGKDLAKPEIAARVLARFSQVGVDTARLVLHGWAPTRAAHFAVYDRVDIALDTYPYNGATTSCEALWMGVPVVTLAGATHASRMGASILAAAGHEEWIARTHEDYVQACKALAADLGELAALRAGLRAQLAASPLMDAGSFAADLERLYREAWRTWCSRAAA